MSKDGAGSAASGDGHPPAVPTAPAEDAARTTAARTLFAGAEGVVEPLCVAADAAPGAAAETLVAHGTPGSYGELLRVALPLIISYGSTSLQYWVDRLLLAWYTPDALAAALPAAAMHWMAISLALGTVMYVNTFVAQYVGAGRDDRVGAIVWQGIYVALVASLAALALVPVSSLAFDWFSHPAEVRALEVQYFNVLCYGAFPMLLGATLGCFFSGRGQTQVVMWVNVVSLGVNAVLDYCLIFGRLGLPEMGMRGAALATVLAYSSVALMYAAIMLLHPLRRQFALASAWRFDGQLAKRLLRFGLPNGVHFFCDVVCFTLFIQLVGGLGKRELTATNLAFSLNGLVFVPLLGLGIAVSTLTGQRIGQRRPDLAARTTWKAFFLAAGYVAAWGLALVLAPDLLLAAYAAYAEPGQFAPVAEIVVQLLRFIAVYSLFDSMTVVFSAATRGAGDTRFSLLFSLTAGVLLMLIPTWIGIKYTRYGLATGWTSATIYIVVLGIGFLLRFLQGKWQRMRVIETAVAA